jgi:hypothetical protein
MDEGANVVLQLNTYNTLMAEMNRRLLENRILIEFTKCCGYSFMLPFFKTASLADLYKEVGTDMENYNIKLFVEIGGNRILVVPDPTISLKDFIKKKGLTPVYPIPAKVVYRFIYDDGHAHP